VHAHGKIGCDRQATVRSDDPSNAAGIYQPRVFFVHLLGFVTPTATAYEHGLI
jgi:hypothetical protein